MLSRVHKEMYSLLSLNLGHYYRESVNSSLEPHLKMKRDLIISAQEVQVTSRQRKSQNLRRTTRNSALD
jgi:hypothetical protein